MDSLVVQIVILYWEFGAAYDSSWFGVHGGVPVAMETAAGSFNSYLLSHFKVQDIGRCYLPPPWVEIIP